MSINKTLVQTYQLLQKYDAETTKFTKLSILYGKLKLNEKLLTKIHTDYMKTETYMKLTFFKNTNIECVYSSMTEADKATFNTNMELIKSKTREALFMGGAVEEHKCGDDCSHNDAQLEKMLGGKKMKKMLKKKGVRAQLTKQLGKQYGMTGDLESMLLKTMKGTPEGDMFSTLLNNPMIKSLTDQLLTNDNMEKMKTIFVDFVENSEVVDEINKIRMIFNEEKVLRVMEDMFKQVQNLDDITKMQNIIETNSDLQELISTFETALTNGLINQERLVTLVQKASEKFMAEFKNMDILNSKNMGMLSKVMSQFGGDMFGATEDKKEKMSKKERRAKAQKKYRRELKKKNKKNKKRNQ